ncbi:MAG: hypothetical protein IJT32_05485, partial [Lachnospiraceae bacterium]|nr:hypothetical protein [Lachnospiraceae bacterium]
EKENKILKRENARLIQDLSMLSNLTDYATRLRNFNEEKVVAANKAKSNFLANMTRPKAIEKGLSFAVGTGDKQTILKINRGVCSYSIAGRISRMSAAASSYMKSLM